ncbi:MAG: hypothetical protein AB7G80_02220 [Dongiaceae bacterium]
MSRLDPNLMTADERLSEIGLILSRGIARRQQKLKSSQTKDMRDYSLDFPPAGSIHAKNREEENN